MQFEARYKLDERRKRKALVSVSARIRRVVPHSLGVLFMGVGPGRYLVWGRRDDARAPSMFRCPRLS
eukprot:5894010-Pyramimonas_sp.AAC.1